MVGIKQYKIKLLSGKPMNFGLISIFCNASDIFDSYDLQGPHWVCSWKELFILVDGQSFWCFHWEMLQANGVAILKVLPGCLGASLL